MRYEVSASYKLYISLVGPAPSLTALLVKEDRLPFARIRLSQDNVISDALSAGEKVVGHHARASLPTLIPRASHPFES
jgi:hypothetical protein